MSIYVSAGSISHYDETVIFQDYSKFNDDDFDLKKWVNAALRSEQNPNTLVMKLQLLMQVSLDFLNFTSYDDRHS